MAWMLIATKLALYTASRKVAATVRAISDPGLGAEIRREIGRQQPGK
jgi:hypothetical protein